MKISDHIEHFIESQEWIFAKTYAKTWPMNISWKSGLIRCYKRVRENNQRAWNRWGFYHTKQVYFEHKGLTYWHMGHIINRCPNSETY